MYSVLVSMGLVRAVSYLVPLYTKEIAVFAYVCYAVIKKTHMGACLVLVKGNDKCSCHTGDFCGTFMLEIYTCDTCSGSPRQDY